MRIVILLYEKGALLIRLVSVELNHYLNEKNGFQSISVWLQSLNWS